MAESINILNNKKVSRLKQRLAKLLYSSGYEQSSISGILQITQPMVSRYLSSESGRSDIDDLADSIFSKIQKGQQPIFQNCIIFSKKKEGSFYLADKDELLDQSRKHTIENMNRAFEILRDKDISSIMPEVKINLVMAKDKAVEKKDIASFNNGFVISDNRIISINGISFGKSDHLAGLLLDLKQTLHINSMMNIKYKKDFPGFKTAELRKDYSLKSQDKDIDILLHKGDFGIEPCAYVLGKDAIEVAQKIVGIISSG